MDCWSNWVYSLVWYITWKNWLKPFKTSGWAEPNIKMFIIFWIYFSIMVETGQTGWSNMAEPVWTTDHVFQGSDVVSGFMNIPMHDSTRGLAVWINYKLLIPTHPTLFHHHWNAILDTIYNTHHKVYWKISTLFPERYYPNFIEHKTTTKPL